MLDVWGEGETFEQMLEAVAAHPAHLTSDASLKHPHSDAPPPTHTHTDSVC